MGLKTGMLAFMATAAALIGKGEEAQALSRFQQDKDKVMMNDGRIIHVEQKFLSDKFRMTGAEQVGNQYVFSYKSAKGHATIVGKDPDNDLLIDQLVDISVSEPDAKGVIHTTHVQYGQKRGSGEFGVIRAMSLSGREEVKDHPDSLAQNVIKSFQPLRPK